MFGMNTNDVTQNLQSKQSEIYALKIIFIQRNNKTDNK